MTSWREDAKYADEVTGTLLEDTVKWIGKNLEPEDVFDDKQLGEWAESNDFTKED